MIEPAYEKLSISRSSYYYALVSATDETLALMVVIDAVFMDCPWYGGGSIFYGALDLTLKLNPKDGSGLVRGKVGKNRSGAGGIDGKEIAFRIDVADMGLDEDGDLITHPLAVPVEGPAAFKPKALTPACAAAPAAGKALMGTDRGFAFKEWQDACVDCGKMATTDNRATHLSAFSRAKKELIKSGHIVEQGDRIFVSYWAANENGKPCSGSSIDDDDKDLIG